VWNRLKREKQMTTDARRLMRLGPAARKERSSNGHTRVRSALGAVVASGKTVFPDQEKLLLGLSRMKENFQVRFLEGGGLVTARFHSARDMKLRPSLLNMNSS
jgi:hypothetical protein